ncbi:DUF4013 domain-containing protein [Haloarcula pellucida]|uniref:DUF4013 domain-containing protein n=1 Tax=Haloarcula pellucida TaxID=1427151 RepID=A0A830GKB0_9EURY|nr:DUF4013 domain-containing protein [Halomicroarcula pellucida]MBX0347667.1 DUF4013 domain-containing protein [Halomicroarcula pellucida]GGN89795.1 hypothetical protein GCM10009030_10930 [Halomicroarcula pellucida]
MFEDALRFPWNGEKKVETLLVGGVLSLLGFLFVPLLFVYGYLVRVVRQVAAGNTEAPPVFDEWGDLLVDGVVAFVISLVYLLVPVIAIAVAAFLFLVPVTIVEGGTGPRTGLLAAGGVLVALLVLSVTLVLLLAALYLLPAGVAAYARTGRFGAAFSPGDLRSVAGDRRYAIGWLVFVAIGVLAQLLAGAIAATGVGALLVPFVVFYGNVASAYAIGAGVADVDIASETDEDATTGQPAV